MRHLWPETHANDPSEDVTVRVYQAAVDEVLLITNRDDAPIRMRVLEMYLSRFCRGQVVR